MTRMLRHDDQVLAIWKAPFADGAALKIPFLPGTRLSEMVAAMDCLPPDFDSRGTIFVGGHQIDRRHWSRVIPKVGVQITFHYSLAGGGGGGGGERGGKSGIFSLIIAVAAIALSVFTLGGGAAGLLGAAFKAGTLGARLLASAIAVAGQLAASALSPPPVREQQRSPSQESAPGAASSSGNVLARGAPIPRVIGTRKVYPPLAAQPFTWRDGQDEMVEVVFCLAGPHDLSDIRIGDTPIAEAEDVEYQIREGWQDDEPLSLVRRYATMRQPGIELSVHDVVGDDLTALRRQINPELSIPRWHGVSASRGADEIHLHLVFPEGIYRRDNSDYYVAVPIRIRLTDLDTNTVYHLPEAHFRSRQAREIRASVEITWGDDLDAIPTMPSNEGWYWIGSNIPAQTTPPMGGWAADASFDTGSDYLYRGVESSTGVARSWAETETLHFVLDDGSIPKSGRYLVEVKRGAGYRTGDFETNNYEYFNDVHDFFGWRLDGSTAVASVGREHYADRVALVRMASVFDSHPIASGAQGSGLALVAVRARNRRIEDLSVVASGYVRDWDGSAWTDWKTTSNPAPHYRDVLRGSLTPDPLDLDLVDDDSLVAWRQTCASENYACDMICEGEPIHDLLTRIASCGFARPRASETWGVIQDYDRSEEYPAQVFTSRNMSGLSMQKAFTRLPDGFRVTYTDAEGIDQQVTVFRDGIEGIINPRLEEVRYDGISTESAAAFRAAFDLRQAALRSTFWSFNAPAEALVATRGDLIGINHHVLSLTHASARIVDVVVDSGGEVTSVILDSSVPVYMEPAWEDVDEVESVDAVEMIGATTSIGIRRSDGTFKVYDIAEGDGSGHRDIVELATPVAEDLDPDDGEPLIRNDCLVYLGQASEEVMRLIVFDVQYDHNQMAQITAVDEAPELWDKPPVMAAFETGSDVASFTGSVLVSGTMDASEEGPDTFEGQGSVASPDPGTMSAIETGSDVAEMAGSVLVSGTLDATESGSDVAEMEGEVEQALATTISFVASATGASNSTAWPTVQAGDVAILLQGSSQNATDIVPDGFTPISKVDSSGTRGLAGYRICDGEEAGSIAGLDGDGSRRTILLVFRGDIPITGVAASTWNAEATSGNPSSQSVLASGAAVPCVVIGWVHQQTSAAFSTATPSFDAVVEYQSGPTQDADAGYKIYNTSPADHTIDAADTGTWNILMSGFIEFS